MNLWNYIVGNELKWKTIDIKNYEYNVPIFQLAGIQWHISMINVVNWVHYVLVCQTLSISMQEQSNVHSGSKPTGPLFC